jgi:hypothetical protein
VQHAFWGVWPLAVRSPHSRRGHMPIPSSPLLPVLLWLLSVLASPDERAEHDAPAAGEAS